MVESMKALLPATQALYKVLSDDQEEEGRSPAWQRLLHDVRFS